MHDNARIVASVFNANLDEIDLERLDWPPRSLALNQIVWDMLGMIDRNRHPKSIPDPRLVQFAVQENITPWAIVHYFHRLLVIRVHTDNNNFSLFESVNDFTG